MRLLRFPVVLAALSCLGGAALVQSAAGQSATATSLTVTSGGSAATTVKEGTAVTLTATVTAGSTPVTPGLVEFCDAAPPHCSDIHLLGTAQLTASGTAVLRFYPAQGTHTYDAVFVGTKAAAKSSASAPLNVLSYYPTTTSTSYAPSTIPGDASLNTLVTGLGGPAPPTGTVSMLDTSNGNYVLATVPLTPGSGGGGGGGSGPGFGAPVVSLAEADGGPTAVADFNGDGKKDLVVAYSSPCIPAVPQLTSGVNVLLGNGDGTLTNSVNLVLGTCPMLIESVVVADFNGDGKADFAVATQRGGPNAVTVYLGNGDGTFAAGKGLPASATPVPVFVAAGDFNGDGLPDLAVANSTSNTVNILLSNGDGTFTMKSTSSAGNNPVAIAVADFDGDGKLDMAVANAGSNNVTILLGSGDGTFTAMAQTPGSGPSPQPTAIVSADFNGDGIPDLAVTDNGLAVFPNSILGMVTILLGNGDGTFTTAAEISGRIHLDSIAVGDFNADGKADIAVSDLDGLVQVLLGDGNGIFELPTSAVTVAGPYAVAAADFNGDGIADIAAACNDNDGLDFFVDILPADVGGTGGTLTASGTASNFAVVGSGVHQVVASYSGDSNYAPSVSAVVGLLASRAPTTLAFTANPATSNYAQPVTLTALVSPNTAQNHNAGGTMTFTSGNTLVGTAPVVSGVATFTTTMLNSGVNTLTASYSGDADFVDSTATAMETVNGSGSVTTLTVAPNPALVGQAVTLTVGVVGISYTTTPTGSITFYSGTTVLGQMALDATGHATYTVTALPVGGFNLTAVYSGDASFYTSTSPVVTLMVNPYASSTTLTVTPNPAATGQPVTLTAGVTGVGATAIATGTVTFRDGTTVLGTATLDATGHAALTTAALAQGSHNLTAAYAGSAMYAGSTSAGVVEVVQAPTFSITLSNPSLTLETYQHATTTVTLTSAGNFSDAIAVSCGNVPKFVTCIFQPSPTTLVVNGATAVSFYLDTDSIVGGDGKSGPLASGRRGTSSGTGLAWALMPVGLVAMFTGRRRRVRVLVMVAVMTMPLALLLGGCGSSEITPVASAAPGVYAIPVTATGVSSGVTHTAQLMLTVTP